MLFKRPGGLVDEFFGRSNGNGPKIHSCQMCRQEPATGSKEIGGQFYRLGPRCKRIMGVNPKQPSKR